MNSIYWLRFFSRYEYYILCLFIYNQYNRFMIIWNRYVVKIGWELNPGWRRIYVPPYLYNFNCFGNAWFSATNWKHFSIMWQGLSKLLIFRYRVMVIPQGFTDFNSVQIIDFSSLTSFNEVNRITVKSLNDFQSWPNLMKCSQCSH